MSQQNIFAMSFPVLESEFPANVVCQGHVDYCAEHGHATHTVDGVVQGFCPRCGVVLGAQVAAGVVHLHTISDVKLQNAQNDTVTTGRPVLWIINGERVEYTREELEAEMIRRENKASTAQVSQHNARCSCGMNQPLMPGHAGFICKGCQTDYDLPELVYGLDVTITGTR